MEFLTLALLITLPFFLSFFLQKFNRRNLKLPPGPKGLPFVGNLFQLDNSNLPPNLLNLSKKYGPLMSLQLGNRKVLVVSSAEMAKQVMKTYDLIFCSRPSFLGQQKLSYNGLDLVFSPYDAYWRDMRKICIIHLFNSNKVQSFRPIREYEVSKMVENVSEIADASKPVNLTDVMTCLTSAIMCRIGLGRRYDQKEVQKTRFQALLMESQAMFSHFFVSDYFPLLGFVDRLNGSISRLEKCFREFDEFYEELIKEHLDPNRPKPDQEDILDILLQMRKDGSFKVQLKFDHIKAVLMNVFIAGTETSAASVVWAMTYLMKNPKAMRKVQEEIRNAVGKKGFVYEEDIPQLTYLKAVIKETMRLQPTVPLLVPRELTENCKLDGYDVEQKTIVHVNAFAIGRDPEAWENPEEFSPERFIGKNTDVRGLDFELVPFGAGRRICPGMNMGLAAVEIALSNLLYKFNWEFPKGIRSEDIDMVALPGITMHKKTPLRLMATKYV